MLFFHLPSFLSPFFSLSLSFSHLPTLFINMSAGHLPICHIFWPGMGSGSLSFSVLANTYIHFPCVLYCVGHLSNLVFFSFSSRFLSCCTFSYTSSLPALSFCIHVNLILLFYSDFFLSFFWTQHEFQVHIGYLLLLIDNFGITTVQQNFCNM